MAHNKFNFETAIKELNQIVESMEHGDLALEESLKKFERGIALARTCQTALQSAEQKVKILTESHEQAELSYFQPNNTNE